MSNQANNATSKNAAAGNGIGNQSRISDFRGNRPANREFQLRGINHLALVCRDMARTVDFYQGVLGMPLVKTIQLPFGGGQHFFFDIGNGDCLAFFWFPDAPEPTERVVTAEALPGRGDFVTAIASMNHVAFDVAPEHFDLYRQRLIDKGIDVSDVMNHDDSELTISEELHPGVYIRSMYFRDPDGILLEFATWLRELRPEDASHQPASSMHSASTS
jgi:catechol 2,3-dioxygenase-like lactoylglutathione lyase family enzyme